MPEKGDVMALTVNIRFKPDKSGVLVAQCREFPFIIVKGNSVDNLTYQVFKHLEIYMNNFPEEAKKIMSTYGRKVDEDKTNINQEQKQEVKKSEENSEWQTILVTMPHKR